jgi:hypothetical protein
LILKRRRLNRRPAIRFAPGPREKSSMRLRSSSLLVACAVTLLAARAARPAEQNAPSVTPGRLIERLASTDFAEREAATRALDEMGAAALPDLRRAAAADDPEVRRRVGELAGRIERRAESARLLEPRRVRLVCKDTPVPEALADLTRQTGFAVELWGDTKGGGRRLTLDTGPVSFWEALDRVCRTAGVSEPTLLPDGPSRANQPVNPYAAPGQAYLLNPYIGYGGINPYDPNPRRIILVDGRPPELPACYAGAVRVRSLPAHVPLPVLCLGAEERVLPLEVAAEPGVTWEGVVSLRVTRAVDDRGRRLTQAMPFVGRPVPAAGAPGAVVHIAGSYIEPPPANDPRHIPVRLRAGPDPAKRLTGLEGVVTAQVQTPPEDLLCVDNVLDAAGRTVHGPHGGWLKVVEVSRDAAGVVRVQGEVAPPPREEGPPDGAGSVGPGRQVVFLLPPAGEVPALELRDARGQPFGRSEAARGQVAAGAGPVTFRLAFTPRAGQTGPAQLVYVGRRTVLVDVPFVLRDVPLP